MPCQDYSDDCVFCDGVGEECGGWFPDWKGDYYSPWRKGASVPILVPVLCNVPLPVEVPTGSVWFPNGPVEVLGILSPSRRVLPSIGPIVEGHGRVGFAIVPGPKEECWRGIVAVPKRVARVGPPGPDSGPRDVVAFVPTNVGWLDGLPGNVSGGS